LGLFEQLLSQSKIDFYGINYSFFLRLKGKNYYYNNFGAQIYNLHRHKID